MSSTSIGRVSAGRCVSVGRKIREIIPSRLGDCICYTNNYSGGVGDESLLAIEELAPDADRFIARSLECSC